MTSLTLEYPFEVAHRWGGGRHRRAWHLPGGVWVFHRHVLEVEIEGEPNAEGIIADYETVATTIRPVIRLVDQRDLESLPDRCSTAQAAALAKTPTSELLVLWFAARLGLMSSVRSPGGDQPSALHLASLRLREDGKVTANWRPGAPHEGGGRR